MGNNKISTYDSHLIFNPDSSITWLAADGVRYTFELSATGGYVSIDSDAMTLAQVATGYEITTDTNYVYSFDAAGLLTSVADNNGNTTLFHRTGGLVTSVVDGFGNTTILTYNAAGKVASITDSAGKTVTYSYDAAG